MVNLFHVFYFWKRGCVRAVNVSLMYLLTVTTTVKCVHISPISADEETEVLRNKVNCTKVIQS